MINRKQADRIVFQTTKHHKQLLRSQIDPALIEKIQIHQNPSFNYINAYRNLYNDQLNKTLQMHQEKKQKNKQITQYDNHLFCLGMRQQKPPIIDQTNMTSSQLSNYGRRFVDYDEEKILKYQDHTIKNYDGGQAFFKQHEKHLQRKQIEAQITNKTLSNQIQYKEFLKIKEQERTQQQNEAFNEFKYRQKMQEQKKFEKQRNQKLSWRQDIVNQMEEERERKQRKSSFEYKNIARHNPITNPIEYHIDNPYILKEIQNRNSSKTQSVYQIPRR